MQSIQPQPMNFDAIFLFRRIESFLSHIYTLYLADFVTALLPVIKGVLMLSSAFFAAVIIFLVFKINKLAWEYSQKHAPVDVEEESQKESKVQWEVIMNHAKSPNQAEWKLAILEADNILDDLLKEIGYEGETLAEKLREIGDGELAQWAWEAHKVRNRIAHEAQAEITQHEAKRVIALYKKIFKKLGYL